MAIKYYSISISPIGSSAIFSGYFNVDTNTNLVTGFYDLSLPTNNGYTDVILPTNDIESWQGSTNIFPFDFNGLNFYSTDLQKFFSINQNHFNIYLNGSNIQLYVRSGGLNNPYKIDIV